MFALTLIVHQELGIHPMCENCDIRYKKMASKYKWDSRYIDLAEHISSWSKDPSSKIGAVAIGENGQVLSTGYNGFPRGIEDSEARLYDRETKYSMIVHAEMNVIYNASLSGVSLRGATLYVVGLPICNQCALGIIQSGINRIVIRANDLEKSLKWQDAWNVSKALFKEAGVTITLM